MASTSTDNTEPGQNKPRVPWYKNPNWLLLVVVVAVGFWLFHLFTQNQVAVQPSASSPTMVAHVYRKPIAPARIVQHGHTSADGGVASPYDLTGRLVRSPKVGNLLLAFGSAGFGCVPAPGWVLVGGKASDAVAVAYHVVQPGDGKLLVPFTTTRANNYTLELVEIAGGPDIVGSSQAGGSSTPLATVTNNLSLAVPQTGGILFQLYAGSGTAAGNGPPKRFSSAVPSGQQQSLVDRVPAYGWGSELIVQATTTDPRKAPQPFSATEAMTFAGYKLPGNIVTGWLVWVGGATSPNQK